MLSLFLMNFVKISSSGVIVNKDGGNIDLIMVFLLILKFFINNKEFIIKCYFINIVLIIKIN